MNRSCTAIVMCLLAFAAPRSFAQIGTAFTYQGQLTRGAEPYTGSADVVFSLWSSASGGVVSLANYTASNVQVTNGLFSSTVDFGNASLFSGGPRYVGISVRTPAGSGAYSLLNGRQELKPTPYALFAPNAGNATTAGSATTAGAIPNITPFGDNTLIGTGTTPAAKVHVVDSDFMLMMLDSANTVGTWQQIRNTSAGGRAYSFVSTGSANGEGAGKLLLIDSTAVQPRVTVTSTGSVGIGTFSPAEKLEVAGNIRCDVLVIDGGADVAEKFDVHPALSSQGETSLVDPAPGMVVVIDKDAPGKLRVAGAAYSRTVAGIISGANGVKPGLLLGQPGTAADGKLPVASVGRVWCYADADANGPIEPGDLLTSSATPGHAMKATDVQRSQGAVLGKAMSGLENGRGLVLVLVTLQ